MRVDAAVASVLTDRTDVDGAERSNHSTDQQEQRAKIRLFRLSRKSFYRVKGSNQNDCPPVQYSI